VLAIADLPFVVRYPFEIVCSLWLADRESVGVGQTIHSKFCVVSCVPAIPVEHERQRRVFWKVLGDVE
jgi:hypothetical protein